MYGEVSPDWSKYTPNELVDLAAVQNGGVVVGTSDMFFGSAQNLLMPGRAANMGDGWETKRRRGPGFDWAIIRLGRSGIIKRIEVDTNHFKGNYPDQCSIEGGNASANSNIETLSSPSSQWKELLPKTKLHADTRHFFEDELRDVGECSHVRLNIFPDGGVSRLRVWGKMIGL